MIVFQINVQFILHNNYFIEKLFCTKMIHLIASYFFHCKNDFIDCVDKKVLDKSRQIVAINFHNKSSDGKTRFS